MTIRQKIWSGLVAIFLILFATASGVFWARQNFRAPVITPSTTTSPAATSLTPTPASASPRLSSSPPPTVALLPTTALIKNVPFIEQAPHKNWDATHEETCEEAAVLTVVHYLEGERQPTADEIETELQNLIVWEERVLGRYEDTTAAETSRILSEYFSYGNRVHLLQLTNLDTIKTEIAAGRPVIVPAAGRLLGNRYFKSPGPVYHMVVVTGYDEDEIITNDPGTQHGAGYRYPADQFWNAIHDFVDRTDEGMATGAKVALVVD